MKHRWQGFSRDTAISTETKKGSRPRTVPTEILGAKIAGLTRHLRAQNSRDGR